MPSCSCLCRLYREAPAIHLMSFVLCDKVPECVLGLHSVLYLSWIMPSTGRGFVGLVSGASRFSAGTVGNTVR